VATITEFAGEAPHLTQLLPRITLLKSLESVNPIRASPGKVLPVRPRFYS
jgi:hypothetical protein